MDMRLLEYYVYSANNTLVDVDYNYQNYKTQQTFESSSLYDTIYIDAVEDVKSAGYDVGEYNTNYFFYRNLFLSNYQTRFYIN